MRRAPFEEFTRQAGYVPAGLLVRRVDIQDDDHAGARARASPDRLSYTTVALRSDQVYGPPSFTPGTDPGSRAITSRGRPVPGHPTWVQRWPADSTDPDAGSTLIAPDIQADRTLSITGGHTVTSLAGLYRIADAITVR